MSRKLVSATATGLLRGGPRHGERVNVPMKSTGAMPIKLPVGDSIYIRRHPSVAGVGEYDYSHTVEEEKRRKHAGIPTPKVYERRQNRDPIVRREPTPMPEDLTCSSCADGSPCDGLGL